MMLAVKIKSQKGLFDLAKVDWGNLRFLNYPHPELEHMFIT